MQQLTEILGTEILEIMIVVVVVEHLHVVLTMMVVPTTIMEDQIVVDLSHLEIIVADAGQDLDRKIIGDLVPAIEKGAIVHVIQTILLCLHLQSL